MPYKNKEDAKKRRAEYYAENRELQIEQSKEWKAKNKERHNEYQQKYRENNRQRIRDYIIMKRLKNKLKAIDYLGGECENIFCSHMPTMPYHYDIHHTKGKNFNFGGKMHLSWDKIKKEIDDCECVLLCKFCHSDITNEKVAKALNTLEELE